MRGRKKKQESRAAEFRERLIVWKQMPESSRPSLRALARELYTSHQMLAHCLYGLDKWQAEECWRRAKEVCARAKAENRPMTPWEANESHALDRRAMCLFMESALEDHVEKLECEIEQGIGDGKAPVSHVAKMLRMIVSIRGGAAVHRGAQRAQAVLLKYFSPEGRRAVEERVRNVARPKKAIPKLAEARYHEIRLQKLVERFEEIGGVLLFDERQVRYFVPEETAASRVLVTELAKYHDRLRQRLTELRGKVNFEETKAEICQRFPGVSLNPLESKLTTAEGAGNSAKPEGRRSDAFI
jgi:hypothetical protein